MRRHRKQVEIHRVHVYRHLAGALRRIRVKQHAALARDLADGGEILDHADLVVHVHDRNQNGIGADGGLELVQIEQAVRLRIEIGDFKTLALQLPAGIEHRLVLGLAGDNVLALLAVETGHALEREVIGFGRTRSPDDLLRIGADQCRHVGARLLDGFLGMPAEGMGARGRVAKFTIGLEILAHPVRHARVHRRGGGVIEIYRFLHFKQPKYEFSPQRAQRSQRLSGSFS